MNYYYYYLRNGKIIKDSSDAAEDNQIKRDGCRTLMLHAAFHAWLQRFLRVYFPLDFSCGLVVIVVHFDH